VVQRCPPPPPPPSPLRHPTTHPPPPPPPPPPPAADQLSTALFSWDSPSIVRLPTAVGTSARVTEILRAFALSATGMLTVSTPSW
jgi:hypothetical protein